MKKLFLLILWAASLALAQAPVVSVKNSTTSTLTAASVFTGGWEDVSTYQSVRVLVKADAPSATGGFVMQWSNDSAAVVYEDPTITVDPGKGRFLVGTVVAKYFRLKYTNGAANQSTFKLQTTYQGGGGGGGAGDASAANQTSGSQKTQIVDGSGNVIASTANNLNVQCANCSGSGASAADAATFTAGASVFAPSGLFYQTTATNNALTSGQQGMIQGTAQRAAFVNLRNASGTEIGTSSTPVQVTLANTGANATAVKVDNSAVTQPISASSLPLPTGAATAAKQPALGTAGTASTDVITVQGIASMTALRVDPSAVTSPVSVASLPLPSGASTAAKQPALGTAGNASADVISVQGIASGTALAVSGTITANAGTNLNTSALALDATVGRAQGSTTSGQTGPLIQGAVTTAAPSYTTAQTSPLSLTTAGALRTDASATTQPISVASLPLPSGAATAAKQPALGTAGSSSTDVISVQGVASGTALAISAASLPLPSSAATSTKQSDGSQKTQIVDGSGSVIASTANALNVQCANCSGSGVSATDEASFTAGSSTFAPGGGLYQVTQTSNPLATGQQGAFQVTRFRALHTTLRDSTGAVVGNASNPIQVSLANTGSNGTAVSVTCGNCSGSGVSAADEATFTAGSTSQALIGGFYQTTATSNALTTGQQGAFQVTANRALFVNPRNSSGTEIATASNPYRIDPTGTTTQPVSGTVTSNIGTTNGLALDATIGRSQGSTTSGQTGPLIQGAVTTSAPSYTTAQTSPLSLTTAGALRTDASATTQPVSGTVTANAGTGTFATNVSQINGVTPLMGNGVTGTGSPRVTIASDNTAFGVNLAQYTPASGRLPVDGSGVTQPVSGTITANIGTSGSLALDATLGRAQGSTTSGQTGPMIQGAVTTSAPSYTTAQTSPLSLTTAGALRTDASATTQPVSGTITANAGTGNFATNIAQVSGSTVSTAATGVQKVGVVGGAGATIDATLAAGTAPTNGLGVVHVYNTTAPAPTNGQTVGAQADQAGNLRVAPGIATAALSVWNSSTSINTTQNIFTNSGAPAALVHLVQSGGTFSAGAATFEITYDNSNWITVSADAVLDPTSTTNATQAVPYTFVTSTNKAFLVLSKGAQGLRVKLSTAITGTGTVTPNYALLPYVPVAQTILGASSATIGSLAANQSMNLAQIGGSSTATGHGTASGALRVELPTDGTGLVTANPGTAANWAIAATGAAVPANAQLMGAVSSGNLTGIIQADNSTTISMTTATTTQLVALSSGKKIYVTAWDVMANGAGTFKLVYGTGSNCGTGTTDLTGAYDLVANTGLTKGGGIGPVIVVPASQALCATSSAAVNMRGSVAYTQF